jgi:predicted alpha/beta-fold hydrolase
MIFRWNVFHGARILDVDTAAKVISKAKGPNQILAGVGYSMGAIVISNYVARSGEKCHLDAAMSISGGLDMREMLSFKRSMRLWQPMLAQTLRDDFIVTKFDNRFRYRLTKEEYITLMRASSVSEIDIYAIVSYNGFDDLEHYYTEMSAMGDTAAFQADNGSTSEFGRIADVSIPFCVLHALDDPLTSWRTIGHDPEKLVNTGSGNIMLVLTSSGGHVGWPMGYLPQRNGWKFMNDAASNFVNSVHLAKNSAA